MTTQPISHKKILLLLTCLSISLLLAVILFRQFHLSEKPFITAEKGFIFPESRTLKPFHLNSTQGIFTEKNLYHQATIIFFGFSHCDNICPLVLQKMNVIFPSLKENIPQLQFIFISLDPERDTISTLKKYLNHFNPNFIGASGLLKELHILQSQLGVYGMQSTNNLPHSTSYQIIHTQNLFLFSKEGKWLGLINSNLPAADLKNTLLLAFKNPSENAYVH